MIKRILFFLVVLLLVVPSGAMANDAFWNDYNSENMQITITRLQDDFSIGKDYSFQVAMVNTTKWDMKLRFIDCPLFENSGYDRYKYIDEINPDANLTLSSGEKLTVTCTIKVPYNIAFRKDKNDFYYDLAVSVNYILIFPDDGDEESDDFMYGESIDKPVPIKVNNLYDGSNMLSIDTLTNNFHCIYTRNWDNANDEEYAGSIENTISVANLATYEIKDIYVNNEQPISLSPSDSNQFTIKRRDYIMLEDIPDSLIMRYQALFQAEEKYYAVILEKEIEMLIASPPDIDITMDEIIEGEDSGKLKIKIKNISGKAYQNFFFGEDLQSENKLALLDDTTIIPAFKNKTSVEYILEPVTNDTYIIGYSLNNYYIKFEIDLYESEKYGLVVRCDLVKIIDNFIYLSEITPSPTPTLSPSPSPTPTLSPRPTETSTPTPEPTVAPTDVPTQEPTTEIVEVKKESSIPFWVWYVLVVAVIVSAMLMISFRKKIKEDEYD